MFGTTVIIGGVVIALAIVYLVKFTKGAIVTTFAVAVIFVGLFLVVGAPALETTGEEVVGLIPWTGSAVYTGEALSITSLSYENGFLNIDVNNGGTRELKTFDVFVNEKRVDAKANVNKLLPRTDCTLTVDYEPVNGDVILVKSGLAKDKEIFSS